MRFYAIPPWILQTIIWIPTRLSLKLFCGLKVNGLENIIHLKKGIIFATNHTSELDPILIPASLPFLSRFMPMFYTSRERNYYKDNRFGWKKNIYGGNFFKAWGAHEVLVGQNNYELALKNHVQILKDEHSICIFPEGRKNTTGGDIETKGGIGYLAYKTNSPIIPVAISGAIEKKNITIEFGRPLYPRDIFEDVKNIKIDKNTDDCKKAAAFVMAVIKKSITK
ncbi:MAG TPA: lysophospholipid acyltransferase family protein [Candidatus Paceibacterota bacterium]|nr:lysophospholipid acyltransferase family protein [Candidatus Paceibacterota bacterium]